MMKLEFVLPRQVMHTWTWHACPTMCCTLARKWPSFVRGPDLTSLKVFETETTADVIPLLRSQLKQSGDAVLFRLTWKKKCMSPTGKLQNLSENSLVAWVFWLVLCCVVGRQVTIDKMPQLWWSWWIFCCLDKPSKLRHFWWRASSNSTKQNHPRPTKKLMQTSHEGTSSDSKQWNQFLWLEKGGTPHTEYYYLH